MKYPKNLKLGIILILIGIIGILILNYYNTPNTEFKNNGERIYFTATSDSNEPIFATMGAMSMHSGGMMTCADCHGSDARGGYRMMMMWGFNAPDIRYSVLSTQGHGGHGDENENEKPYNETLLKRAITKGLDSEGKRLEPPMPIWHISDKDLNDLIEFLKTLK